MKTYKSLSRRLMSLLFFLSTGYATAAALDNNGQECITHVTLSKVVYDSDSCCCPDYEGLKVSFQVYKGAQTTESTIWAGYVSFSALGVKSPALWSEYEPYVALNTYTDKSKYRSIFKTNPPIEQLDKDLAPVIHTMPGTQIHKAFNKITPYVLWELPIALSIEQVLQHLENLKDENGEFPRYKFVGYDYTNNVANCVVFSCRLIKELGVAIEECEELNSWLYPSGGMWGWFGFQVFGAGYLRQNIGPRYAIKEIWKHRSRVRWRYQNHDSGVPFFKRRTIKSSLQLQLSDN